jgi:hypothetical protein
LGGGAHSMSYEIFNKKPVIIDNQTGRIFKSSKELMEQVPSIREAGFTRLDNADLNMDYLLKWVKNA